jgi:hypothetical protein
VGDGPGSWRAAGFDVGDDDTVRVGSLVIDLDGGERRGLRSWALSTRHPGAGDALVDGRLDGLRTTLVEASAPPTAPDPAPHPAPAPSPHPNGVNGLDHLVLVSPDVGRTTAALATIGLSLRRTRPTDQYGPPMVQCFLRAGPIIVELIGPAEPSPEGGPTRFFGLAFTVADLDATARLLGAHLGRVKDAVQPGRRIATLRHAELDLSVPVAFMSPEPTRGSATAG